MMPLIGLSATFEQILFNPELLSGPCSGVGRVQLVLAGFKMDLEVSVHDPGCIPEIPDVMHADGIGSRNSHLVHLFASLMFAENFRQHLRFAMPA
jgi:hypothetical protein